MVNYTRDREIINMSLLYAKYIINKILINATSCKLKGSDPNCIKNVTCSWQLKLITVISF